MTQIPLDDLRCRQCHKLLLKGTLGLGVIEVKCTRCGVMNLFHALDDIVAGRPKFYVLVFNQDATIIAASKNVENMLGYTEDELIGLSMPILNPAFAQPAAEKLSNYDIGENNVSGRLLGKQAYQITHYKKDGTQLPVIARYYPFGSFSGELTMIILAPNDKASAIR